MSICSLFVRYFLAIFLQFFCNFFAIFLHFFCIFFAVFFFSLHRSRLSWKKPTQLQLCPSALFPCVFFFLFASPPWGAIRETLQKCASQHLGAGKNCVHYNRARVSLTIGGSGFAETK